MSTDLDLELIKSRAKRLAAEDRRMRRELVGLRRAAGLTQQDVADFMGCTQQAVQKLERYDADPQLSTLRRYAVAVGAIVEHRVTLDAFESSWVASRNSTATSKTSFVTVRLFDQAARATLPSYSDGSKSTHFSLAA